MVYCRLAHRCPGALSVGGIAPLPDFRDPGLMGPPLPAAMAKSMLVASVVLPFAQLHY